jgi:hypothetical protein
MRVAVILLVALVGCVAPPSELLAGKRAARVAGAEVKEPATVQVAAEDPPKQTAEPKIEKVEAVPDEPKIIPVPRVQCVIVTTDGDWCAGCKAYKIDSEAYAKAGWSVGPEPWNQIRFVMADSLPVKERPLTVPKVIIYVDGVPKEWYFGYRKKDVFTNKINEYRNRYSDAK